MTRRRVARRRIARRAIALLVSSMAVALEASAQRPVLTLERYARTDGAITVFGDGSHVEPYFAMRALNTAADLGADVDSVAHAYIAWQMRRLDDDSTFKRYCIGADSLWTACGSADADDAALGLWIELLYRTAGRRRMPPEWKRSADQSRRALAALLDPRSKVYVVSPTLPVALFMDNIEILSALETSSRTPAARIAGDRGPLSRGAARLRLAITREFWDGATRRYRVSSQASGVDQRFYPEIVAQAFPVVFGYGNPRQSSQVVASQWLLRHERDWIAEADSGAAWGLIAVAAARTNHREAVARWLERAERVRSGAHWTVADEAIHRVLGAATAHQRIR